MQTDIEISRPEGEEYDLPPVTSRPVGSLAKIKKLGWDPRRFHSCSAPEKGKNLGCQCHEKCRLPFKGTRPHYLGVQLVKAPSRGSGIVQTIRACFDVVEYDEKLRTNKMFQKVVAQEGGKIRRRGTKVVKEWMDGGRKMQEFAPLSGADMLEEVPRFPEPEDRPELVQHAFAAEVTRGEEELVEDRAERLAIGALSDEFANSPNADASTSGGSSGAHEASRPSARGKP